MSSHVNLTEGGSQMYVDGEFNPPRIPPNRPVPELTQRQLGVRRLRPVWMHLGVTNPSVQAKGRRNPHLYPKSMTCRSNKSPLDERGFVVFCPNRPFFDFKTFVTFF